MSDEKKKEITYYVNGEIEKTERPLLKVRKILESAGFVPADSYTLRRIEPKPVYDFDSRYDEEVDMSDGEEFEAKHKGPTPTS